MKISYRNHLGIKIIETGFFMAEAISEYDKRFTDALRTTFQEQKKWFKPIKIISKNMAEAIQSSSDKMIEDEIWNDVGAVHGSILMNGFTYCYFIRSKCRPEHDFSVFIFYAGKIACYGWQNINSKRVLVVPETSKWLLKYIQPDGQENWRDTVFISLYTNLICAINFLKYADVEDKKIKANSKEKGIDCKYINTTNSDIHYITSNYIHNLYVQGAFKVRGHWRLQPKKKDGEWTKELIWINDFEKHGYTRKAGILKNIQLN